MTNYDVYATTTACNVAQLGDVVIPAAEYERLRSENARFYAALTADDQTLRLHLGEMTAQEMRTLRAGFRWALARAILGGDND